MLQLLCRCTRLHVSLLTEEPCTRSFYHKKFYHKKNFLNLKTTKAPLSWPKAVSGCSHKSLTSLLATRCTQCWHSKKTPTATMFAPNRTVCTKLNCLHQIDVRTLGVLRVHLQRCSLQSPLYVCCNEKKIHLYSFQKTKDVESLSYSISNLSQIIIKADIYL